MYNTHPNTNIILILGSCYIYICIINLSLTTSLQYILKMLSPSKLKAKGEKKYIILSGGIC